MKVAVLCEYSGIVRDSFIARGHEAVSCDIIASEAEGPHIQDDCRKYDWKQYPLVIAFPPCTHLAVSGARWFAGKEAEQREALLFVQWILQLDVPMLCMENPVGIISSKIRKPDQIIQPWMFGEPYAKKTCLWLKGLPLLKPSNILTMPASGRWLNQTPSGQNNLGPSKDRGKLRSKTYQGIADAMASQWG